MSQKKEMTFNTFDLECPNCRSKLKYKTQSMQSLVKDPKTRYPECPFVYHIDRRFLIEIRDSKLKAISQNFEPNDDIFSRLKEKLSQHDKISIAGFILLIGNQI